MRNKDSVEVSWEAPFTEDTSFNYEVNPVVKRFMLINETNMHLRGHFKISPKSAEFLNFRIPASKILISIKPKSVKNIVILTKIFPEMSWGEFDTHIELYSNGDGRKGDEMKKVTTSDENAWM